MKNIITIQHTQSVQHTNGMVGSWTDWDLTELGVEQAKRIGARLFRERRDAQYAMYASDLLRAKHTAALVAGLFGVEPILTNALREFNLGEAVGKSKEWARENAACALWPGTIDWPLSIDDRPFTGAESKREVWNRLSGFMDRIMAGAQENLIIVSHSGALRLFYALWLGLDVEMLSGCELRSNAGGVSFMHEDAQGRRVLSRLNDLSYRGGDLWEK